MKKFFISAGYALRGLKHAFRSERNIRIEFICTLLICAAGYYFEITKTEWLIICLNIGTVLTAELLNTAIEKSCDLVSQEIDQSIKVIKDISAGGVLIMAAVAAVCGLIIFLPYIIRFTEAL